MMRRFNKLSGFLHQSSKASLATSIAASLTTTKLSRGCYFFSAQPDLLPHGFKFSQANSIENDREKQTSAISMMSRQNIKPDTPTPKHLRSFKLSALDQVHSPSYVPFVFFYPNNHNVNTNIDNIILERSKLLKQSLSETLTRFYPLAGKLVDDSHIDCNDEGVYYLETQVDANLLSFIAKPDYKLLHRLLPVPPNSNEATLGFYLVMIQVNFFSCGGVAVSMCNSHKFIDGATYTTFLNAWASAAKGELLHNMVFPNFVSSSLFLQNTQAPKYPSFPLSSLAIFPTLFKSGKCSTKRFLFDASSLNALKAKATASTSSTRVVAVTSLIWKCATKAARSIHGDRPSILQLAVNIRSRFSPPLPQNTAGNIIWNAVARCESNDKLTLDTMVGQVNAGLARLDTSFVEEFKGEQGSLKVIKELKWLGQELSNYEADYYGTSSMCRSGISEADFGWGKPVWSCYGNFNDDIPLFANVILLMDTSTGDGIEAWVTLSEEEMAILERDPDLRLFASVEPSPLQR